LSAAGCDSSLLLGTLATISLADQPAPSAAYVNAGQDDRHFFKMVPDNGKRPARGEAYEVAADGRDRLQAPVRW
jgi:hypothetical protein